MLPVLAAHLAVALCACGDAAPPASLPQGAPQWCAVLEDLPPEGQAALVRARSPCTVRLTVRDPQGVDHRGKPRRLTAGAQVRVTWDATPTAGGQARTVTPADRAAGRTAAHQVQLRYGFGDTLIMTHAIDTVTRPTYGEAHIASVVPPAGFQAAAWDQPLVLCTAAITDWSKGEPTLRAGTLRGRPATPDPEDRDVIMWLVLEFEPL